MVVLIPFILYKWKYSYFEKDRRKNKEIMNNIKLTQTVIELGRKEITWTDMQIQCYITILVYQLL